MANDSQRRNPVMEFSRGNDPESPPNKRSKTLALSPGSSRKGKEKMAVTIKKEAEEEEHHHRGGGQGVCRFDSAVCGICLSEDGKPIRGFIDSCDHYFCFVCIMEWAKIESLCPMCKQRFKTIRRGPKEGVFAHERIVNIPIRDQVYDPHGNAITGPSDPYIGVQCSVCNSSSDESLLLLCDLCDSAAHTYCVGLGHTVPEGDWYCHDCTVSRNEHSNNQIESDYFNQDFSTCLDSVQVGGSHISVYQIIREKTPDDSCHQMLGRQIEDDRSHRRITVKEESPGTSLHSENSSSPAGPPDDSCHQVLGRQIEDDRSHRRVTIKEESPGTSLHSENSSSRAGPVRESNIGAKPAEPGARTLQRCRSVHGRIRALRENWNALRQGSVGFSSPLFAVGVTSNNKRHSRRAVANDKPAQPESLSVVNSRLTTQEDTISSERLNNKASRDINRAWKLMKIAKSSHGAGTTGFDRQIDSCPSSKRNTPKAETSMNVGSFVSKSKPFVLKELAQLGSVVPGKSYQQGAFEILHSKCKSQGSGKQNPDKDIVRGMTKPMGIVSENCDAKQESKSVQLDICQENMRHVLHVGASNSISNKCDVPPCLGSVADSSLGASEQYFGKPKIASSPRKTDISKMKVDKISVERMFRKDDGAKSEVQSLVKLNLKLLSRERHLGVDKFKEVARLATHTILAACGFEHSKTGVWSFPNLICKHGQQFQQHRSSKLMPGTCRECFDAFVKDVINSITAEKTDHVEAF